MSDQGNFWPDPTRNDRSEPYEERILFLLLTIGQRDEQLKTLLAENQSLSLRLQFLELEKQMDAISNCRDLWIPRYGQTPSDRLDELQRDFLKLKAQYEAIQPQKKDD